LHIPVRTYLRHSKS